MCVLRLFWGVKLDLWGDKIPEIKYLWSSSNREPGHLPSPCTQSHNLPKQVIWGSFQHLLILDNTKQQLLRGERDLLDYSDLVSGGESQSVPMNWKTPLHSMALTRERITEPAPDVVWTPMMLVGKGGTLPCPSGQPAAGWADEAGISVWNCLLWLYQVRHFPAVPQQEGSSSPPSPCMPAVTTLTTKHVFISLSR